MERSLPPPVLGTVHCRHDAHGHATFFVPTTPLCTGSSVFTVSATLRIPSSNLAQGWLSLWTPEPFHSVVAQRALSAHTLDEIVAVMGTLLTCAADFIRLTIQNCAAPTGRHFTYGSGERAQSRSSHTSGRGLRRCVYHSSSAVLIRALSVPTESLWSIREIPWTGRN